MRDSRTAAALFTLSLWIGSGAYLPGFRPPLLAAGAYATVVLEEIMK